MEATEMSAQKNWKSCEEITENAAFNLWEDGCRLEWDRHILTMVPQNVYAATEFLKENTVRADPEEDGVNDLQMTTGCKDTG